MAIIVALVFLVAACSSDGSGAAGGSSTPAPGPVTAPPEPGAFRCPAQVLAGSPPTSRLADMTVTRHGGFDRVTFIFVPGPPDKPAADSGLIVRPVGVVPKRTADGAPVVFESPYFLEVRFRDMALTSAQGGQAFEGQRDLRLPTGIVREVVEVEESRFAVDWIIGATSRCVRVWTPRDGLSLMVDVSD